jgi:hypothetical protein
MKTKLLLPAARLNIINEIIRMRGSRVTRIFQVVKRTHGSCVATIVLIILLFFNFCLLSSQIPHGFNYQAIARDGSGNPIVNANIKVKLSILTDTTGFYATGSGTYLWEEEQTNVKTNSFGLFTVVFGNPSATKTLGSASSFSSIDWAKTPLYLGTKIANPTDYKIMGSAQLWSVPYSMVSDSTKSLLKGSKLSVVSSDDAVADALFEVKRKDGQTVFAVYPNAVNIYVPRTTPKGVKGGFAIGGFEGSKTDPQDYFRVTPDSVRIYIDKTPDLLKGATKGGFAIGGFDQVKGWRHDLFTVSKDSVRVYIDKTPSVKGATKGGFAIGGYDEGKGGFVTQDLLTVSNDSIRMYINDITKGTTKGGFAIGGFGTDKGSKKFLNIETDETGKVNPSVNRILWYPYKNAFLTGRVLVEHHDSIGENSFGAGFETKPKGNYSQAFGYGSISRGNYSTSIGYSNVASGAYSLALGYRNVASGLNSFAIGFECKATGENAFAFGDNSVSQGPYTYAIGYFNNAVNGPCYAFGDKTQALTWGSTTFGWYTKANAEHSLAMGSNTYSNSYCGLVLGQANDTTVLHWIRPGTVAWGSYNWFYGDDPIFTIGNGDVNRTVEPPVVTRMSNAFIVLKNGKTGINMNYPTYMLDVNGEITSRNDNAFRLRNASFSTIMHHDPSDFYLLVTNNGDPDGSWNSFRPFRINYSSGNVYMGSNDNGSNFSLTVLSDGKVGIGASNPAAKLELFVNGNNANAGLGLNRISEGGKRLTLNQGELGKLNFTEQGVVDLLTIDFNTQNVGIGNTSPGYKLTVNGTAWCSSGAWTGSDIRWKKNISDFNNILSKVLTLNTITYDLRCDEFPNMGFEPGRQVGLIAQDVEKVFPHLVKTDNKGFKAVAYDKLSAVLVEAIKEQQEQIESTKLENQQLKSELQLIKEKLEQIEASLAKSGSK